MKCKICGKTGFRDLKGINKHYKKAHPGHGKRKKKSTSRSGGSPSKSSGEGVTIRYCPRCGEKLGG